MDEPMTSKTTGRRRVIIHDAAGLLRLCLRLFFYWKLPRIEVRIAALPALVVQYAQHRVTQLTNARNTLLGEVIGIVVLLGGAYTAWWMARGWQLLGMVAAYAVGGWLAGKVVNGAWTRIRLLALMLHLRVQLAVVSRGRIGAIGRQVLAEPRKFQGYRRPWKWKLFRRGSAAKSRQSETIVISRQAVRPKKSTRPKVSLRQSTDIDRLILRVASRWKLPRVEIPVAEQPSLEVQRAQHLFVRLSETSNCLLGGLLGAAALVGASFYLIWIPNQTITWARTLGWDSLGWVLAVALGAALIGAVIELIWTRMRLVLVLLRLRRRIGTIAMRAA
jgi:hypothetical protein